MGEFQKAVGRLTNWQRNQWARAGYPGLQRDKPLYEKPEAVAPFQQMVKP